MLSFLKTLRYVDKDDNGRLITKVLIMVNMMVVVAVVEVVVVVVVVVYS